MKNVIKMCESAGEYFMKMQLFDMSLHYLIESEECLQTIDPKVIEKSTDWKILKIRVMKGLSTFYQQIGDTRTATNYLKKFVRI